MCEIILFRKALRDYELSVLIMETYFNDELGLNNAAYHLQQCIEKVLKGYLECVGVTVPRTHKIGNLLKMSANNGSAFTSTEWLDAHAEMLETWESETRYNAEFLVEYKKIREAVKGVSDVLKLNGICQEPDTAITPEIKTRLLAMLPKNRTPADNLEWNIFFRIYRSQLGLYEHQKSLDPPFSLDDYFKKYGITDKEAEIERLKILFHTTDMEQIKQQVRDTLM